MNLKDDINRLRMTGYLEAVSWLGLLFVAMPLKYFAGKPVMVKYVGWIHGILFILYLLQLLGVWGSRNWKFLLVFKGFLAALLPFGTLIFDKELKKQQVTLTTNP